MTTMTYIAQKKDEGLQIKEILIRRLNFSSRFLRKLKNSNGITKNNMPVFMNVLVEEGDVIHVLFPEEMSNFEPEDIPIETVYEDENLLIINKQPGIVVHPTKGHPNGTIANALVHYMEKKREIFKIRFVNRLDRDTSGLLIIGKNAFVQEELSQQMAENLVTKKYIAIVEGILEKNEDIIHKPIKKNHGEMVRIISEEGQASITEYKVLQRLGSEYTVVELILRTGRTHQIRVHMSSLGHPVVGDELYGIENKSSMRRQALHAEYLSFIHPVHKNPMEVRAKLPYDMQKLIIEYSK